MRLGTVGTQMPLNIYKPEWVVNAACLGVDTTIFFPERPEAKRALDKARKICNSCLVSNQCLDYAIETDSPGIWAGTSPKQRAEIVFRRTGLAYRP